MTSDAMAEDAELARGLEEFRERWHGTSTLHTYNDVQRTPEWFARRRGMVTASVIGSLLTPTLKVATNDTSRGLLHLLVGERISGFTDPTYESADMLNGVIGEDYALDVYREHYAPVESVGFMVREFGGFSLGYSPDGLVGSDGLVEVKTRRQKKHVAVVLADEVPAENMAQIQAGLLVSGRSWCDYIDYTGGMHLWRKRVEPDAQWHNAILDAVEAFEKEARRLVDAYMQAVIGLPMTERIDLDAEIY